MISMEGECRVAQKDGLGFHVDVLADAEKAGQVLEWAATVVMAVGMVTGTSGFVSPFHEMVPLTIWKIPAYY